ncbi:MAG: hypothetical protein QF903_05520 [Planctomycetota bacterium]|jgi:hypothetical protein|nr:hypothetical protein [Planctomycetota bacterium]MDP6761785.1 hypothetical protein [Planctomycetota bacterium]MDP6988918.1 hypothetical protein [Planctomycetota bacterium]
MNSGQRPDDRRRGARIVAGALAALCSLAACSVPGVTVQPRYGTSLAVSGSLDINADEVPPANERNTVEEIGVGENDGYYGGRVELEMGDLLLSLTTQSSAHQGAGQLESGISDGEVVIGEDAFVETDFHFGLHQLQVIYDVVSEDSVTLGLGLGATSLAFDTGIDEFEEVGDPGEEILVPTGVRLEAASDAPVPVLVLRFAAVLGRFSIALDLSGMDIDIDGDHLSFMDAGLEGTLWLLPEDSSVHFALLGGYRYTSIDLTVDTGESTVNADMSFSGPYIGLGLSF